MSKTDKITEKQIALDLTIVAQNYMKKTNNLLMVYNAVKIVKECLAEMLIEEFETKQ